MMNRKALNCPPPGDKDARENLFNTTCNADNTTWHGCFGKLLNDNWEMNY